MWAVPSPWCSQLSWSDFGSAAGVVERAGLMQVRTIKTRQGQTPKFAGCERTYLGENFFSSGCFNALWTFSLSNRQAESNVLLLEVHCGFGVNKKVVCSLRSLRDLGTFHRTVPGSAGENRELSWSEPQPVSCSTLEEAEKQQGLRRLSLASMWELPTGASVPSCCWGDCTERPGGLRSNSSPSFLTFLTSDLHVPTLSSPALFLLVLGGECESLCRVVEPKFAQESECTIYYNLR